MDETEKHLWGALVFWVVTKTAVTEAMLLREEWDKPVSKELVRAYVERAAAILEALGEPGPTAPPVVDNETAKIQSKRLEKLEDLHDAVKDYEAKLAHGGSTTRARDRIEATLRALSCYDDGKAE